MLAVGEERSLRKLGDALFFLFGGGKVFQQPTSNRDSPRLPGNSFYPPEDGIGSRWLLV